MIMGLVLAGFFPPSFVRGGGGGWGGINLFLGTFTFFPLCRFFPSTTWPTLKSSELVCDF